ncbi:hypothetical protein MHYP_G00245190 [Metynnis hypsauchen]
MSGGYRSIKSENILCTSGFRHFGPTGSFQSNSVNSKQQRMKSVLLLTLVISWITGHCDDHNKAYSDHNNYPCLRASNTTAYKTFLIRHLILENFNVEQRSAWADYLNRRGLCGRTGSSGQSFFQFGDINDVINICNGQSIWERRNLCKSIKAFDIYYIESKRLNFACYVTGITRKRSVYAIVACDLFIGVVCLPVHYEGQDTIAPNRNQQLCRRRIP